MNIFMIPRSSLFKNWQKIRINVRIQIKLSWRIIFWKNTMLGYRRSDLLRLMWLAVGWRSTLTTLGVRLKVGKWTHAHQQPYCSERLENTPYGRYWWWWWSFLNGSKLYWILMKKNLGSRGGSVGRTKINTH